MQNFVQSVFQFDITFRLDSPILYQNIYMLYMQAD